VGERRRAPVFLLGEVVPLAQHHRVACARSGEEVGGLVGVEDTALQDEAALGIVGQPRVIARLAWQR
jgi:hypothetical protein